MLASAQALEAREQVFNRVLLAAAAGRSRTASWFRRTSLYVGAAITTEPPAAEGDAQQQRS
jgi:hypothetical protein